ncbi:MAG TPA: hypothetical protein VFH30_12590, partial [Acidimicrobiales bacterium]|nr:hypothetical protein [Acidimicrobiales bacterium]
CCRVAAQQLGLPAALTTGLPVTTGTADHVSVTGATLPSPGTWIIEVTAVRAGSPLVFSFEVPIR